MNDPQSNHFPTGLLIGLTFGSILWYAAYEAIQGLWYAWPLMREWFR